MAEALSIGWATANRTLRAWRERRSLKGKKRGGGNPSPLRKVEREFRALVEEFSDATAEELATVVGERLDVRVSRSSLIGFHELLFLSVKPNR
jgi:transposase